MFSDAIPFGEVAGRGGETFPFTDPFNSVDKFTDRFLINLATMPAKVGGWRGLNYHTHTPVYEIIETELLNFYRDNT